MANNSSSVEDDFDYYFGIFEKVSISSSVFLSIVALATVIINGISLYAIYKDPLKCFRNPFSVFITGILVSDFLTGLVVEPVFVASYTLWLTDVNINDYVKVIRSSQILSAVTINTSFLTVLALAVAQLIALRFPSLYNRAVKTPYAVLGIVAIWIYAILFAVIPEMAKISIEVYFMVDLILHTTLISVALVIIYIFIYFVFRRAMRRHQEASDHGNDPEQTPQPNLDEEHTEDNYPSPPTQSTSNDKIEKDFLMGSFIVIVILMVTVWPFTICLYVWLFRPYGNMDFFIKDYIALIFFDDILFLKFFLDPLVFVWRLPKYRKAISIVLTPARVRIASAVRGSGSLPSAGYHRQTNLDEDSVEERLVTEREWSADINSGVLEITDEQA